MELFFNKLVSLGTLIYMLSKNEALALIGTQFFPTQCQNFTDNRVNNVTEGIRTVLMIPPHLTSGGERALRFLLEDKNGISQASRHEKKCKVPVKFRIPLTPGGKHELPPKPYPFQDQWKFSNDMYFTSDGYLHRNSEFWNPNDYCIQSISDTNLEIKSCPVDCSADLSKTKVFDSLGTYQSSRVCIPKCCGVDEILSLEDKTCRKLNDTEPNYFLPYLHVQDPIWFLKDDPDPKVDKHKILVIPNLNYRRASWNKTHGIVGGFGEIWGHLHFSRNTLNCTKFISENTSVGDTYGFGRDSKRRYNFRVEVHSGMVKLKYLTNSRKWVGNRRPFCVDGLDNWGIINGTGVAITQVVVQCVDDDMDVTRMEGQVANGMETEYSYMKPIFLTVLVICEVFLMFGFWMYWMIRQRLNFNGRLFASHLGTLTFSYLCTAVANSIELEYPRGRGSNAVVVVSNEFEEYRRIGLFCVGFGITCHFLYLSTIFWLSALNNGVRGRVKEYWAYAVFGWGIPALFVAVIFGVDQFYNDPWSEAVVPDYGVESCQVASWSAGYYFHLPVGLVLGLNIFYILVRLVRKMSSAKDETPGRLFAIFLGIHTVAWLGGVMQWIRAYNGHGHNWASGLLLIAVTLFEALSFFHFYCMNELVWGLVIERVPRLKRLYNLLKSKGLLMKESGLLGCITEDEEKEDTNDTIVIEGFHFATR